MLFSWKLKEATIYRPPASLRTLQQSWDQDKLNETYLSGAIACSGAWTWFDLCFWKRERERASFPRGTWPESCNIIASVNQRRNKATWEFYVGISRIIWPCLQIVRRGMRGLRDRLQTIQRPGEEEDISQAAGGRLVRSLHHMLITPPHSSNSPYGPAINQSASTLHLIERSWGSLDSGTTVIHQVAGFLRNSRKK